MKFTRAGNRLSFLMKNNRGFTLVEVLVSMIIFALVIVGLLSVFISSNKLIIHSRERMMGAQLGKFFLDPLQSAVVANSWDDTNNDLSEGTRSADMQVMNKRTFNEIHVVDNVADTDLRRVVSNISWTESSI